MDNQNEVNQRPADNSKEWKLIEKVVMDLQGEQRKSRRWGIFFKLLTAFYVFAILALFRMPGGAESAPSKASEHVAVIEVSGVISADQDASADNIIGALRDAFDSEDRKSVV